MVLGADYSFGLISIETHAPQFIRHNKLFLGSVYRIHTFFVNIIPRERHLRHDFYFMKWKLFSSSFLCNRFFISIKIHVRKYLPKSQSIRSWLFKYIDLYQMSTNLLYQLRCLLMCYFDFRSTLFYFFWLYFFLQKEM